MSQQYQFKVGVRVQPNHTQDEDNRKIGDMLNRIQKQITQRTDGQKAQTSNAITTQASQESAAKASENHTSQLQETLSLAAKGDLGADIQKAARNLDFPLFNQTTNKQTKTAIVRDVLANPTDAQMSTEEARQLFGTPEAQRALPTSQLASAAMRDIASPANLKSPARDKAMAMWSQFIQKTGDKSYSNGVREKLGEYSQEFPEDGELLDALGKTDKTLLPSAQEAIVGVHRRNQRSNPGEASGGLQGIMNMVTDPQILKNIQPDALSQATQLLCREGASPSVAAQTTRFLKNGYFENKSAETKLAMLKLGTKHGADRFFAISDPLLNEMQKASPRKHSRVVRFVDRGMTQKGAKYTSQDLKESVQQALRKEIELPKFKSDEPIANMAAAKLMLNKMSRANNRLCNEALAATSREQLAAVPPYKVPLASWLGPILESSQNDIEVAAQRLSETPGGPDIATARYLMTEWKAYQEGDLSRLQKQRSDRLQALRFKRSANTPPKKSRIQIDSGYIRLPSDKEGNVVTTAQLFASAGQVGKSSAAMRSAQPTNALSGAPQKVSTASAAMTTQSSAVTSEGKAQSLPKSSAPKPSGWLGNGVKLGLDPARERVRLEQGGAVKAPVKSAEAQSAALSTAEAKLYGHQGYQGQRFEEALSQGLAWKSLHRHTKIALSLFRIDNDRVYDSYKGNTPFISHVFKLPWAQLSNEQKAAARSVGFDQNWDTRAETLSKLA